MSITNKIMFSDIFKLDLVKYRYQKDIKHEYCNILYDMFITIETIQYQIINFRIGIQCIESNTEKTGIYIDYTTNNQSYKEKITNQSDINKIKQLVLLNIVDNKSETIQTIDLNAFLITHNAFLKPTILKTPIAPSTKLEFTINYTTPEQIDAYVKTDRSKNMIFYTGLLNSNNIIEDNLYFLGLVDGVKSTSESDNVLTAFNSNSIFNLNNKSIQQAILKPGVNLNNAKINSMDCYIDSLEEPYRTQKNSIRIKYGIIRTTIDFFHDYVSLAVIIFQNFLTFLKITHADKFTGAELAKILQIVESIKDKVTTSGGNVSQTACKNLWSSYAIQYRQELSISCFPISDFGNIGNAEIYKDNQNRTLGFTDEFDLICDNIRSLGINYFYIEAQNTPLATAFVAKGFGMVTSNIAKRDAAPGYSIQTAIKEGLKSGNAILVNRTYNKLSVIMCPQVTIENSNSDYGKLATITNSPNCLISKFLGLSDMIVQANNVQNDITSTLDNIGVVNVTNKNNEKTQELGLNALIASTNVLTKSNYKQLRGTGNASAISQISMSQNKNNATEKQLNATDKQLIELVRILVLSLKTYTDYCQADEIEQLKTGDIKVLAASSDFLASSTFADFFATPSVYVGINKVIVTCSDTRFGTLTQDQLTKRLINFNKLIVFKDIIKQYIVQTIKYVDGYINSEKLVTLSPSTYYGCSSVELYLAQTIENAMQTVNNITDKVVEFNNSTFDYQTNFLKQFPDELSIYISGLCKFDLLSITFNESNNIFTDIIRSIVNIPNRLVIETFLDIYYKVEQEITNALPTNTSYDDLIINIISIYTVAISTKSESSKNSFIYNLNSAIDEIKKQGNPSNLSDVFTTMKTTIELIYKLNQYINTQLKIVSHNTISPTEMPHINNNGLTGGDKRKNDQTYTSNESFSKKTKSNEPNIYDKENTNAYDKEKSNTNEELKIISSQLQFDIIPNVNYNVNLLISYNEIIKIVSEIKQNQFNELFLTELLNNKQKTILEEFKKILSGGKKKTKKTKKTRKIKKTKNNKKTRRNKTIRKMKNKTK